jgi:hypothetical protein
MLDFEDLGDVLADSGRAAAILPGAVSHPLTSLSFEGRSNGTSADANSESKGSFHNRCADEHLH